MNFLTKIIFYFRKPKVIIVVGRSRILTSEAIFKVLKSRFRVRKLVEKIPSVFNDEEIFIIETDLRKNGFFKKIKNLLKFSQLPTLVVTHIGEIPQNYDSFSGRAEDAKEIEELAKIIPTYGFLILNFDDRTVRKIDELTNLKSFTFGFEEKSDFRASDIHTTETGINPPPFITTKRWGVNFKINYKGKIIPIWQEGSFSKEKIYNILAASCVGTILGLNLVEISEALKKDLQK